MMIERRWINRGIWGSVTALLLAACGALTPVVPTLTPTWEYSAPTMESSPTFVIRPPTDIPPDYANIGQSNPMAAALPWDSDLPPMVVDYGGHTKTVQIALRDNTILFGTLHEMPSVLPGQAQRLPGVLLIGETPEAWGIFPAQLRDAGFTVLVMDMQDRLSSTDFIDVIQAFAAGGSVHPGLVGVIGASEGADQALIGCAVELLCDAAVLLSPIERDTLANVVAHYNPRPLLLAASRNDAVAYEAARAVQAAATGRVTGLFYERPGRGAALLLAEPELFEAVILWMRESLVE